MALYLHLGASGSGKTHQLYQQIFQSAAANPDRSFLLIVPEQFTLQTQRDMIRLHEKHGIMNIDVLSFPRMAHRIFEELGVKQPVILEDTGKSMIVKKVALDNQHKLSIYGSKVNKQGFIDEMKSVIAEFYQYGIDDERLDRMMELASEKPRLQTKLKDISVIYKGFREFIDGRFIMNEELLDNFCDKVAESKVLKDACIYFDGFTGFTVSQLKVIKELFKRVAADIHVTLTIDKEVAEQALSEEDLFYLSSKTILKLEQIATEAGAPVIKQIIDDEIPYRFAGSPALARIEHCIFRPKRIADSGKWTDDIDAIRCISCDSPTSEIRYVIGQISKLANEEKIRYREMAVVSKDPGTYGSIARREFARVGINCFIDEKHNIIGTAPVEMLRAALEIAEYDYSFDGVFRFIKSGMTPLSFDEISKLENFCLALGIRGKSMWTRSWKLNKKLYYQPDIDEMNRLRESFLSLVGDPVEVLKSKTSTVNGRLAALSKILDICRVKEKLEESAEKLVDSEDDNDRLKGREDAQLYDVLMQVFERIGLLLGEDVISPKEFREILETGFKEAKLALTPPGSDGVLVGDIERSRLTDIKVLFFVGVNDSIIPGGASDKGLLSEADRSIFAEGDIELSPTGRQTSYLNEFYLYLNMTKPSKYLYLSYHRMTGDKKIGRPAYIIASLKEMFESLVIKEYYQGDKELLKGTDPLASAANIIRDKSVEELTASEQTILNILKNSNTEAYDRILKAAFFTPATEAMTPDNAKKLYDNILVGSVSLLEKYAQCAFAHFLNYGLRLQDREEFSFGGIELGNIYHKAIELYGKRLKADGISWHETDENLREKIVDESVKDALSEYGSLLEYSKRNAYAEVRIKRAVKRTVEVLDAQIKAGSFEPAYFEEGFKHANAFMQLRGVIDRMDICEINGKKYLRVIDYKSGSKKFDLNLLYYGLQIQLGVYMNEGSKIAESKLGEKANPAGMYYYLIEDPFVEPGKRETPEEAITKELKLKGPTIDKAEVFVASDSGFASENSEQPLAASYASPVIEVKTDKNRINSGKQIGSENYELLTQFLDASIRERGEHILAGDASVAPYRMDNVSACEYCGYKGVCGFDKQLGFEYRDLHKYGEDDIWQILSGAVNSEK